MTGKGYADQDVCLGHTGELVQVFLLYFTINFGGEHHVHGRLVFQFVERALQVLQRIATLLHNTAHLRDDVEHIVVDHSF